MAKFPPSPYQQDIIDWVKNGIGNVFVNAKAGSGKTTTLELIAQNYSKKMLFIAFNNHIVREIEAKPELQPFLKKKAEGGTGSLKVYTVNSLGNMAVLKDLESKGLLNGKNLQENKLGRILDREIRSICQTRHAQVEEDMIWQMVGGCKTVCNKVRAKYITGDKDYCQTIIDNDGLCDFSMIQRDDGLSFPILPWAQICDDAIEEGTKLYEEKGIYDFTDQIYLPVVKKLLLPEWLGYYSEFIGVDECQDLSALQLAFLQKFIKMKIPRGFKMPTRFLFVRRPVLRQFILLLGADCHSIQNIKRQFKTEEMPLTICYRCAKKIIKLAQKYVPDIEASPTAPEGEVHIIDNSEIADYVQPKDMVIARKNKDLAEVFLQIVLAGKPVYIKDKEMVESTIKSIRNLGCSSIQGLQNKLGELQKKFKEQMLNPETTKQGSAINNGTMDIYDMINKILDFFINVKNNPLSTVVEKFIDFIQDLFITEPSDNAIIVSSIHQVKGLEAKRVFIINYNLMPYISKMKSGDENQQEYNLVYIAITRAKEVLFCCQGELDEVESQYYSKELDEKSKQLSDYDEDYYDKMFKDVE